MGDSNVPNPQCTRSAKNSVMEQPTSEKRPKLGFKQLPTYKSLHCVHGIPYIRIRIWEHTCAHVWDTHAPSQGNNFFVQQGQC